MRLFSLSPLAAAIFALTVNGAAAQEVVFFEGTPTSDEILYEIGVKQRSRGITPGAKARTPVTRALVNPGTGGRFDQPAQAAAKPAAPAAPAPAATAERTKPAKPQARVQKVARTEPAPELLGGKWIGTLVQFGLNDASINSSAHDVIDVVGETLTKEPSLKVVVSGHADKSGGDAVNRPLSRQRAEAVRAYLMAQFNIAPERMQIRAASADEPLKGHDDFHPRNRRVQFGFIEVET